MKAYLAQCGSGRRGTTVRTQGTGAWGVHLTIESGCRAVFGHWAAARFRTIISDARGDKREASESVVHGRTAAKGEAHDHRGTQGHADAVLDDPKWGTPCYDEAENRLHAQKGVMACIMD